MKLRIKITFETEHFLLLRKFVKTQAWCRECRSETDFITEEKLQQLCARLDRSFQTDQLHTIETPEGTRLVCLASIVKEQ